MIFGNKFNTPPISSLVRPGSWTPLKDESSFTIGAVETVLDYAFVMKKLPPNINVNILKSGVQVVAGLNIYLELEINDNRNGSGDDDSTNIKAIVNIPYTGGRGNVEQIYIVTH